MLFNIRRVISKTNKIHFLYRQEQGFAENDKKNILSLLSYTPEESKKIVNTLNSCNLEELLNYDITKVRANKLHAWRLQNNTINCLDDILSIEGFAHNTIEKLYNSIIKSKKLKSESRARIASFVTPTVDALQLLKICNSVSVHVGVTSISWCRLQLPNNDNNECLVTHWQHYDISGKKMHLHDLVERCYEVQQQIPMADCYVFENPQMAQANNSAGNVDQKNVNIQRAQITAVLTYGLAARTPIVSEDSIKLAPVYFLRRFLAARLFSTLIGAERISSEETIQKLMENVTLSNACKFPIDMQNIFLKSQRTEREFLGQVLLLNLAFIRLVLLQDAESIAAAIRTNNSIKNKTNLQV